MGTSPAAGDRGAYHDLDAASAEPLHPAAREVLLSALDRGYADPRRLHRSGRSARLLLDNAREVVAELGRPNLKLQFDIYHCQMIHGEVLQQLKALLPITGHVQISSVPGRFEPASGEVDDIAVLRALEKLGYKGLVGCEYNPRGGTLEGLSWMKQLA